MSGLSRGPNELHPTVARSTCVGPDERVPVAVFVFVFIRQPWPSVDVCVTRRMFFFVSRRSFVVVWAELLLFSRTELGASNQLAVEGQRCSSNRCSVCLALPRAFVVFAHNFSRPPMSKCMQIRRPDEHLEPRNIRLPRTAPMPA